MKFEDFSTIEFPSAPRRASTGTSDGIVYVFFWVADGAENPFYVGQTNRFSGRMSDYSIASFTALLHIMQESELSLPCEMLDVLLGSG
jgi:hypothetical protein